MPSSTAVVRHTPSVPCEPMARQNPWRTLRARPHITLVWADLPDGTGAMWHGDRIILDPRLGRIERNSALTHELVHEERRIGRPHATPATMQTEERQVRRETARRLVPLHELEHLVEARAEVDPVTVAMVATEFEVTDQVAAEAIRQLQALMLERELARSIRRHPTAPGDDR